MALSNKTWRWSFDFAGQAVLPGVQAPPLVEEKAWEVQAAFIRRVDDAVKELSGGAVDLERLAGSLRVLPASPEWVAVQRALGALEAAARFRRPPNSGDVDVVRAYTALLEQSGEVIALALVCGTLLGTGVPGSPSGAARLTAGLEAITALALGGNRSPLEVLREVRTAAISPLPDGMAAPLNLDAPPALGPRTLEPWKLWITSKRSLLLPPAFAPDLTAVRTQAWAIWLHRFRTNSTTVADWPPALPELICRAAAVTPSAVLPPALSTLSLEDWSALLVRSLAARSDPADPAYVPAWMAAPALQVLGLGARAAPLISTIPGDAAVEAMRMLYESTRVTPAEFPPETSFLVVRRAVPTRKWMPSTPPRAAVLVLTLADLRALVETAPPPVAQALLSGFGHRVYDSEGYDAVRREADDLIRQRTRELLTTARLGESELLRKAEEQDRPGQTPLDQLMALVGPPPPDASLYARLAAANGFHLPPGLAAFLAAPQRSARGKVRVEMFSRDVLRAGALRYLRVPDLGTALQCAYEGQTIIGSLDGRERLRITMGRMLELKAHHLPNSGFLFHDAGDTEIAFDLESDLGTVRLRQRWFHTTRGGLVTRLFWRIFLRLRFDVLIVEKAETVWGVELNCSVLGLRVLHVEGNFEGQAGA